MLFNDHRDTNMFWLLGYVIYTIIDEFIFLYLCLLKDKCVENNFSGDEPEIGQKATYAQIVTGRRIGSADGSWWSKVRTKGAGGF